MLKDFGFRVFAMIAFATLISTTVFAQTGANQPAPTPGSTPMAGAGHYHGVMNDGACHADREKFCPGMKPGEGLFKCMHEKESQFSAGCKAMVEKGKERMEERHEACATDITKFCKDVKVGHGRVLDCLKQHQAALSAPCKAAFPNMH